MERHFIKEGEPKKNICPEFSIQPWRPKSENGLGRTNGSVSLVGWTHLRGPNALGGRSAA